MKTIDLKHCNHGFEKRIIIKSFSAMNSANTMKKPSAKIIFLTQKENIYKSEKRPTFSTSSELYESLVLDIKKIFGEYFSIDHAMLVSGLCS